MNPLTWPSTSTYTNCYSPEHTWDICSCGTFIGKGASQSYSEERLSLNSLARGGGGGGGGGGGVFPGWVKCTRNYQWLLTWNLDQAHSQYMYHMLISHTKNHSSCHVLHIVKCKQGAHAITSPIQTFLCDIACSMKSLSQFDSGTSLIVILCCPLF